VGGFPRSSARDFRWSALTIDEPQRLSRAQTRMRSDMQIAFVNRFARLRSYSKLKRRTRRSHSHSRFRVPLERRPRITLSRGDA